MQPVDEKTASPFASLVDQVAQVFSSRFGSTLTAVIRGSLGGTQKGVNSEAYQEAIKDNEGLALLDVVSPSVSKRLGKNPLAVMALQALLSKVFKPGEGTGVAGTDNGKKARRGFDFK